MSGAWEQSRAAQALRGAAQLEAGAPPPLAVVREVAGRRAARAATLLALMIAIPLGAMAAGGVYAWKKSRPVVAPRVQPVGAPVRRPEALPEGLAPQTSARETSARETSAREISARETSARETSAPEPVAAMPVAPVAPVAVARPVKRPSAPVATPFVPSPVPSPVPAPVPVPVPVAETPEIPALGGYAPAPPPAAPQRTALADEAAMLSQALSALRSGRDPARALELLAQYRSRFPGGALRHEAALAAAEAHRGLGHTADALIALEQAPRRPDLEVLRAELNAELGRCDDARLIVRGLDVRGALLERALFTDATCALTLGARDEAVADLERLPDSARARELLEKLK